MRLFIYNYKNHYNIKREKISLKIIFKKKGTKKINHNTNKYNICLISVYNKERYKDVERERAIAILLLVHFTNEANDICIV